MHTIAITTEGYSEARIHHNGDWSGDAIINYEGREFELPGEVLLSIAVNLGELVREGQRLQRLSTEFEAWEKRQVGSEGGAG